MFICKLMPYFWNYVYKNIEIIELRKENYCYNEEKASQKLILFFFKIYIGFWMESECQDIIKHTIHVLF